MTIKEWYDVPKEEREEVWSTRREFVTSDESMMSSKWMCQNFIDHMDVVSKNGHQENVIVFIKFRSYNE